MANTLTTLRPDGVAVNTSGAWTTFGSPSPNTLDQATKDNSDSTGAQVGSFPPSGVTLELTMGTVSIPALAQIRSVTPRVKASATSGTLGQSMVVRAGGSLAASYAYGTPAVTPTVYTGPPLLTRPSDGGAWTQADIDSLQFGHYSSNLDSGFYQVVEAYIDVAYNQVPVVSAVTPSGTISITNTPTIGWAYTDPESDPQERLRVKVFDAATIAGVGFNPETSTATVDSGEVFSGTPSWNIPTPLAAGVTYTAYVKVSDAGSGGRYSTWVAGSTFIIAAQAGLLFDAPAVPTVVSATPDPTLNRVALALAGIDNELTRNQSSMETGIAGWWPVVNVAATYPQRQTTAGGFLHGIAAGIIRSAAAGTLTFRNVSALTVAALQAEAVRVVPGQVRTALGSFKSAAATGRTVSLMVTYYDASAAVVGSTTTGSSVTILTSGWVQASVQATVPATAVYEVLVISIVGAAAASEDFYFDQMDSGPGTSTVWTRGGFAQNIGPYLDTFTRADSASAMGSSEGVGTPAWSALTGTWGISGNKAYLVSVTSNAVALLAASPTLVDGVITVDITTSSAAAATLSGVAFRGIDANNYLWADISNTNGVELWKRVGGVSNLLASAAMVLPPATTVGLKVEFFGGLVRVYVDRKDGAGYTRYLNFQMVAADITAFAGATNTRAGLWSFSSGATGNETRFDNFVAGNPGTQTIILERSVDGGTTWAVVRSVNRVDLTDPGQTGTFYDYEAPRGVPVRYRARAQATESDVTVVGAYSSALAMSPNLARDGYAWLKSPSDPTKNVVVPLIAGSFNPNSAEDMVFFQPLGRPDPIIHGGTIRYETFDGLEFYFVTDAAWNAFETLRRRQEPLLLQTCYGDTIPAEYWVRLGPQRAATFVTTDDMGIAQKRRVKIAAAQVATPLVV